MFGGTVTYCLNIPLGREEINVKATILSAILNIGLNIILIPVLNQNGAAVTTMISEFFVWGYCVLKNNGIKKYLDLKMWKNSVLQGMLGCAVVSVISILIHMMSFGIVVRIGLIIMLSIIAYAIVLVIFRNSMVMFILKKIVKKDKSIKRGSV